MNATAAETQLYQEVVNERARRLLDVLSLADAIPHRLRAGRLQAPRLVSS